MVLSRCTELTVTRITEMLQLCDGRVFRGGFRSGGETDATEKKRFGFVT